MITEALRIPIIWINKSSNELDQATQIASESIIVQRPLRMDQVVYFGHTGNSEHFIVGDGWHPPELHHRWTSRTQSLFAFNAFLDDNVILNVGLQIMTERDWSSLQLSLVLNGHTLSISQEINNTNQISMRTEDFIRPAKSFNVLIFNSRTARPSDFGNHGDKRRLGVGVSKLWFSTNA